MSTRHIGRYRCTQVNLAKQNGIKLEAVSEVQEHQKEIFLSPRTAKGAAYGSEGSMYYLSGPSYGLYFFATD